MILDLFAGIRGWGDPDAIGLELDADACATARAAGYPTVRADVTTFPLGHLPRVEGLTASPPCQTFSAAGNRDGIADLGALVAHVHRCVTGWQPAPKFSDPRTGLVLEPLRYALTLVPDWIALEQVPDVLPIWEAYAHTLRALGWSCWAGILNAADFGVPQTRRRAFLIAHRRKNVLPPVPTHCEGGASTMFGELAPWVSMADALGWTDEFEMYQRRGAGMAERHGERPGRTSGDPSFTLGAGMARQKALKRVDSLTDLPVEGDGVGVVGIGVQEGLGTQPEETEFSVGEGESGHVPEHDKPAPDVKWFLRTGNNQATEGPGHRDDPEWRNRSKPYERSTDRPAPTLDLKAGMAWTLNRRQNGAPTLDPHAVPCPTMTAAAVGKGVWTVTDSDDAPVKLTVCDALLLQSFPPDYPVRGTKTSQFRQIGNAVPPVLARAVLAVLPAYEENGNAEPVRD